MQVNRYLFQSPYSSQVQFGTPDPSVKSEESAQTTQKESKNTQQAPTFPNESLQNAQNFKSTQVKDVTPTVSNNFLDIYA